MLNLTSIGQPELKFFFFGCVKCKTILFDETDLLRVEMHDEEMKEMSYIFDSMTEFSEDDFNESCDICRYIKQKIFGREHPNFEVGIDACLMCIH